MKRIVMPMFSIALFLIMSISCFNVLVRADDTANNQEPMVNIGNSKLTEEIESVLSVEDELAEVCNNSHETTVDTIAEQFAAEKLVAINATNFPDPNFRDFIKEYFDDDGDGKLNEEERAYNDGMHPMGLGIKTLKGIEYFPYIYQLSVDDNELTTLDISNNKELDWLSSTGNKLDTIDISNNPYLVYIYENPESVQKIDGYVRYRTGEEGAGLTVDAKTRIIVNKIPLKKITLNKSTLSIAAGKTETLTYKLDPTDTTESLIFWDSNNTKIATVGLKGEVTGESMGRATITAYSIDGKIKASCSVRVLFSDVTNPKAAAYDAIYWGADKGYVNGYGSYFDIDGQCTRAQFVLFLWRAAGKPKASTTTLKFKDKADIEKLAKDYKSAILWGSEKGIVAGFTSGANAGKFLPNDPCTRGQVVTFLWRYGSQKAAKAGAKTFPDVPKTHKYYKAVMWASSYGITTGFGDGTFRPDQTCTRGQCVTFLYRMLK